MEILASRIHDAAEGLAAGAIALALIAVVATEAILAQATMAQPVAVEVEAGLTRARQGAPAGVLIVDEEAQGSSGRWPRE